MGMPLFLSAALQAAAPAATVPPFPAAPASEVVVKGRRHRDVATQVRAVAHDVEDRPFARFAAPVCIAGIGLSAPVGQAIVGRMMEVARTFHVPLAPDDQPCEPNVLVVFLDDGRQELQRLARTDRKWFARVTMDDLRGLKRQVGPVQALKITDYRQDDGRMAAHPIRLPLPLTQRVGRKDDIGDAYGRGAMVVQRNQGDASGRIGPGIRQEVQMSLLVVDRQALLGKTTRQIADYAAMRSYLDVQPDPLAGIGTILSLFDDGATPPDGMTAFDRGYMRGGYAVAADAYPAAQQAGIVRAVEGELGKAP